MAVSVVQVAGNGNGTTLAFTLTAPDTFANVLLLTLGSSGVTFSSDTLSTAQVFNIQQSFNKLLAAFGNDMNVIPGLLGRLISFCTVSGEPLAIGFAMVGPYIAVQVAPQPSSSPLYFFAQIPHSIGGGLTSIYWPGYEQASTIGLTNRLQLITVFADVPAFDITGAGYIAQSSGSDITITLPVVDDDVNGASFLIMREPVSPGGVVILAAQGGNLINGAATYTLANDYETAWIFTNRTGAPPGFIPAWFVGAASLH